MARAAAELFGAGVLVEAATAELKVGVGLGVGQLPRTTYAVGLICSNLSSGTPPTPCATAISTNEYCRRPSPTGTEMFIVLSLSPASKKEGGSWLGR
jgi:hypothetical protein